MWKWVQLAAVVVLGLRLGGAPARAASLPGAGKAIGKALVVSSRPVKRAGVGVVRHGVKRVISGLSKLVVHSVSHLHTPKRMAGRLSGGAGEGQPRASGSGRQPGSLAEPAPSTKQALSPPTGKAAATGTSTALVSQRVPSAMPGVPNRGAGATGSSAEPAPQVQPARSVGQSDASADPESSSPVYAGSAPFELQPRVSRASFHLQRPELPKLYNTIAKKFGVRLLFDRDVRMTRPISDFDLNDVTLRQALEAAGNISRTFVAPVDEHTGVIANDTAQKRAEYERQILERFQIDDVATPQEMNEISTSLRTLLDLRRVAHDNASNWISVLGRARQISAARQFIGTLEKARGEAMVDLDVLEVNTQRARQLGVLPPQSFQLLYLGQGAAAPTVPVMTLGGGRTFYGVQLPGASAPLTYNCSALHSLQRIALRAYDGQQASLRVGEHYPILNGFVSSSFSYQQGTQGTSAIPGIYPSVQYEDLGVIVKATPFLHAGRQMTLKLDVALRNITGQSLNGTPILSNREVNEEFRAQDGGTYVIGGILTHQENRSVSGYPWLSRIPLVGRLFGSRNRQKTHSEILLIVRPHVIRQPPAEEYASNAIYFGRELRGLPALLPPARRPPRLPVRRGVPRRPGVPPRPGTVQPRQGATPQPGTVAPQPGARGFPPAFIQPHPVGSEEGQTTPQTAQPNPQRFIRQPQTFPAQQHQQQ